MLLGRTTILPGGFRIVDAETDLSAAGSDDGVAENDVAWVREVHTFFRCSSVVAAASVWVEVGGGGGGGSSGIRIAASQGALESLGSEDGVVVGELGWVRDEEKFYVAQTVDTGTSEWELAEGVGDVRSDLPVTFSQSVTLNGSTTVNGSATFNTQIDATGHKIVNVLTPGDPDDAATKGYVDNAVGTIAPFAPYYQVEEVISSVTANFTNVDGASAIYLTLTSSISLPVGTYRVGVSYHWKNPEGDEIKIKVTREPLAGGGETPIINVYEEKQDTSGINNRHVSYTFKTDSISPAGVYRYRLRFASTDALDPVAMLEARLELQRVG